MKFLSILFVAVILLSVLTGCGQSYDYTEEYFRVSEPYGSSYIVNGNMAKTEVGGQTYYFAPEIKKSDRRAFLRAQETLSAYLAEHDIDTAALTYYILPDYLCRSDEGKVWFGMNALKQPEQIAATLLGALGDYENYGYITALSRHIAKELKWEHRAPTGEIETTVFTATPALLNLSYPCFTEKYATAEQVAACQLLSDTLLEGMDDPFAGEEAFLCAAQAWATASEIPHTPTYLRFAYNGDSCPLKMESRYFEVMVTDSYTVSEKRLPAEADPMYTVTSIIDFFEELESVILPLQATFQTENMPRMPVEMIAKIPYSGKDGTELSGLFSTDQNGARIRLTSLNVLLHEYVHAMTYTRFLEEMGSTEGYNTWTHEVLTCYYATYYDVKWRISGITAGYASDVSDLIGRPYDSIDDELLFRRVMLCAQQQRGDTNKLPYYVKTAYGTGAASFGDYLVQTYGENISVTAMIFPARAKELTGKTADELLDDWCDWIMATELPK